MFFENIRSERLLMHHAADRLSVRWYLGYDLYEPLPDHSSLTHIRTRYGLAVFRRFFEIIVEQFLQAKLVWSKGLYLDATKINANADLDSLVPAWPSKRARCFRLRRPCRVNCEVLLITSGQNLQRLLQQRGWGRRPLPSGASLHFVVLELLSWGWPIQDALLAGWRAAIQRR
jgi:hypothetical protein